jgi:hypothetical protein
MFLHIFIIALQESHPPINSSVFNYTNKVPKLLFSKKINLYFFMSIKIPHYPQIHFSTTNVINVISASNYRHHHQKNHLLQKNPHLLFFIFIITKNVFIDLHPHRKNLKIYLQIPHHLLHPY